MTSHETVIKPSEAMSDNEERAAGGSLTVENGDDALEAPAEEEKKKKKKKRKSKKKSRAPTGFEDFYADSPTGPAEVAEEQELYSQNRLFIDRIEECIQRYRSKRKFDNEQTTMFNKYMFLGGVDSEQRQFTGIAGDIEAMAQMEDKTEQRLATARDFVGSCDSRFYEAGSDDWVVDFEGIVKGFLSRTITETYQYDTHANEKAARVVKNFLNYVLMHDVCPEYTNSILAARHICDVAPLELEKAHELNNMLPGGFHKTLASICMSLPSKRNITQNEQRLDKEVESALLALSTTPGMEKMVEAIKNNKIRRSVSVTEDQAYKIIDIRRPKHAKREEFIRKLAELNLAGYEGSATATTTSPLGTLSLRKTYMESGYDNAPCSDNDSEIDNSDSETEEFLVEDDLLALCEIGMKLQLTTAELTIPSLPGHDSNSGTELRMIISCGDVRVTFDRFLPQMLMEKWREPVNNTRPAPSVGNPSVKEDDYGDL